MTTLIDVLDDSRHRRTAIGHFNVSDLVALKAVTDAARESKVPILVGTDGPHHNVVKIRGPMPLTTSDAVQCVLEAAGASG